MLALRRLRKTPFAVIRTSTTVSTTPISTGTLLPPPIPETAEPQPSDTQRRGRVIKKRPQISLDNPRDWKRPIAYGVLPAYDEALRYLMKDSAALKREAKELRATISKQEEALERDDDTLGKKWAKLNILEVQSEINLPEVRWKVANGMGK